VIRPETVVVRSEEPVSVEVDRSVVMMSLAQGMYFGLEGVGPRIWALLAQPRSVKELSNQLAGEFDVDPETCLRDVCDFLEELREAQLIRIHDEKTDSARSPAAG
jgi:Coenzyme PQQ synthesis protein D (PqqD)